MLSAPNTDIVEDCSRSMVKNELLITFRGRQKRWS